MSRSALAARPTRKAFDFASFKALDSEKGTFSGYLAVFNNVDLGGDAIQPGAFAKTLADLRLQQQQRGSKYLLPIFFNHNSDIPIGGFTDAVEDEHGLFVTGKLDLNIEPGQRAYSGLLDGYIPGMSIGYLTIKQTWREGVRWLLEVALIEGSVTPIPMNPEALVGDVKNISASDENPTGADAVRRKPRMHHRSAKTTPTAPQQQQGAQADETTPTAEPATEPQPQRVKARDFETVYNTDREASDLLEDLDDMWEALRESIVSILIDGSGTEGGDLSMLPSSLSQFSGKVTEWAQMAAQQDTWADIADHADDNAEWYTEYATTPDDDYYSYGYMSRTARRTARKAGRVMSASNHQAMGDCLMGLKDGLDAAQAQYKALSDMHGRMAPNADGEDGNADAAADSADAQKSAQARSSASQDASDAKSDMRTADAAKTAADDRAGLAGSTTLDVEKVSNLVLMMKAAQMAADMQRTFREKGIA